MNRIAPPVSTKKRPRGLWLCRELPFPLDTGDRIYTGRLVRSVAEAGCDLTLVGFPAVPASAVPTDWPVTWRSVPGVRRSKLAALFSRLPLVGAVHATSAYRALVAELAREDWDFVVFDQYGLGWAMAPFERRRKGNAVPVFAHIGHDHEASVYASLVKGFKGSVFKHAFLWQNWLKTRAIERRIVRNVEIVVTLTEEDAARFAIDAPQAATLVLKPGYDGAVSQRQHIGADVPRNVVMVGNFNWVAKSENLRQFVAAADAVFVQRGITLHVIGVIPPALAEELRATSRATVLHGFVDDIAPHFANARLAVVPEQMGGGFKLKFLDYIFGRVAVATLTHAAAGLPAPIRAAMICRDDMASLVSAIAAAIDDAELLDANQTAALQAAQALFRWEDRGPAMLSAIGAAAGHGRFAATDPAARASERVAS